MAAVGCWACCVFCFLNFAFLSQAPLNALPKSSLPWAQPENRDLPAQRSRERPLSAHLLLLTGGPALPEGRSPRGLWPGVPRRPVSIFHPRVRKGPAGPRTGGTVHSPLSRPRQPLSATWGFWSRSRGVSRALSVPGPAPTFRHFPTCLPITFLGSPAACPPRTSQLPGRAGAPSCPLGLSLGVNLRPSSHESFHQVSGSGGHCSVPHSPRAPGPLLVSLLCFISLTELHLNSRICYKIYIY